MMTVISRVARLTSAAVLACLVSAGAASIPVAAQSITATVDLSKQRMFVNVDGGKTYSWAVSTGKPGWRTPVGSYYPITTYRHYYSKQWRMSLPFAVVISEKGYAIHGTSAIGRLGGTASHGCIRLHPSNAAVFYNLVNSYGLWNVRVEVTP